MTTLSFNELFCVCFAVSCVTQAPHVREWRVRLIDRLVYTLISLSKRLGATRRKRAYAQSAQSDCSKCSQSVPVAISAKFFRYHNFVHKLLEELSMHKKLNFWTCSKCFQSFFSLERLSAHASLRNNDYEYACLSSWTSSIDTYEQFISWPPFSNQLQDAVNKLLRTGVATDEDAASKINSSTITTSTTTTSSSSNVRAASQQPPTSRSTKKKYDSDDDSMSEG